MGLMVNDDGDLSFSDPKPEEAVSLLKDSMAKLAEVGVNTISYGAGPGVFHYPTEVGSRWNWRQHTSTEPNDDWPERLRMNDAHFAFDKNRSPMTPKIVLQHPGFTIGASGLSPILGEAHAELRIG